MRALLGLIVLCLIGAASAVAYVERQLSSSLPVTAEVVFDVAPGATLGQVLRTLEAEGLLRDARVVEWIGRLRGDAARLKAGEYALRPGVTADRLLEMLATGEVYRRSFVLVEGWRMRDLRRALAAAPRLESTIEALDDADLMQALERSGVAAEGRFFPDTYLYEAGSTDRALLAQAAARLDAVLEEEWGARLGDLPLQDPSEALVLASIIEKETGAAADRAQIAGVFVRRLERGMRLQTDPTVIYGLGDAFDGNLRRRDLRDPHPWNTYVHEGLPPTPIAMPGRAAIRAALHPADGNALYFVARGDGSSEFSETLEAHNAAVQRFQIEPARRAAAGRTP